MRVPRWVWPLSLTTIRLVLAPVLVVVAYRVREPGWWLVAILWAGMVSDLLDGIVARRLGVQSPSLRRYDSQTDLVFWLCATWCVWVTHPEIVRSHAWTIGMLLAVELGTYAVSWARFGREACTRAWLAKAWGLTIFAAFVWMLGRGEAGAPFWVMWGWGVAADLDVILITLLLPRWEHDVPSAWHAWRIRAGRPIQRRRLLN